MFLLVSVSEYINNKPQADCGDLVQVKPMSGRPVLSTELMAYESKIRKVKIVLGHLHGNFEAVHVFIITYSIEATVIYVQLSMAYIYL